MEDAVVYEIVPNQCCYQGLDSQSQGQGLDAEAKATMFKAKIMICE